MKTNEKELLEGNKVEPTIIIGCGGKGSDIVGRVARKCVNDYIDNVQFVVMDTDVNDLTRLEEGGSKLRFIQTSSTRSIKDYLDYDTEARDNWFPCNRILDSKTVSEGAGQVRAISRLAINATISQGRINELYDAIDDLYRKNGEDKGRAIKVIIVSTAAGGTGSGIAMEVGMIVRDYINTYYPDSAAIIRGFFIMPGVLDTVIKSVSERNSLSRNAYATIKEINAFMMKGSGFFESDPELIRYKDLSLSVPTISGEKKELDNLPFDFCFLLDRADKKQHIMGSLEQYLQFAADSVYEQNIGPMRKRASSKEDNVVKEFIDKEKKGRSRFGGAGAAYLVYPYEEIVDYIAYCCLEDYILKTNNTNDLSEEEKEKIMDSSWICFDNAYKQKLKQYQDDVYADESSKPILSNIYCERFETGTSNFIKSLQRSIKQKAKNINDKSKSADSKEIFTERNFVEVIASNEDSNDIRTCVDSITSEYAYILHDELKKQLKEDLPGSTKNTIERLSNTLSNDGNFVKKYRYIEDVKNKLDDEYIEKEVEKFVNRVFNGDNNIFNLSNSNKYAIENYLTIEESKTFHPNVARYLLYKLVDRLNELNKEKVDSVREACANFFKSNFDLSKTKEKEETLLKECQKVDNISSKKYDGLIEQFKFNNLIGDSAVKECKAKVTKDIIGFCDTVMDSVGEYSRQLLFTKMRAKLEELITQYEIFFNSLDNKFDGIEKKKSIIVKEVEYHLGDSKKYLFNTKEHLDTVSEQAKRKIINGEDDFDFYSKIHNSIKHNFVVTANGGSDVSISEIKDDIFDDCMVQHYIDTVKDRCSEELNLDVIRATKYEFEINCLIEKKKAKTDEEAIAIGKKARSNVNVERYIKDKIKEIENLAAPGITKNDNKEARDVNASCINSRINDGEGIRIDSLGISDKDPSVSKYELRVFTSIYDVEPQIIAKLSAGINDEKKKGSYFTAYQDYMREIGPDSTMTPVITPHVDKRWNSISVMPELDLCYQNRVMKGIHQSYVYGFLYKKLIYTEIEKNTQKSYFFQDNNGNRKTLIVSNGTLCDELYEVLDALYFDRACSEELKKIKLDIRQEDNDKGKKYEETQFANAVKAFTYGDLGIEDSRLSKDKQCSIFEIALQYYMSLPANKKDNHEFSVMIESIYDLFEEEIKTFAISATYFFHFVKAIEEQYELFKTNLTAYTNVQNDIDALVKSILLKKIRENNKFKLNDNSILLK